MGEPEEWLSTSTAGVKRCLECHQHLAAISMHVLLIHTTMCLGHLTQTDRVLQTHTPDNGQRDHAHTILQSDYLV